jgi:hypothetical protein
MLIVGFLAAGILIIRQLLERRFLVANTVGLMLLIVIAVSVSRVVPKSHDPIAPRNADQRAIPSWAIAARIARHREKFIRIYPDAGSSIDLDVHLTNKVDLVRYLPRAAAIGFFAPFPDMWFASSGRVGSAGRLLSGLETLAMYGVEGLALVGLWRWRRRLSVWLLISVAATNMVALGLVVVNVGALYRLRYTFVILILVVAAEGVLLTFDSLRRTRGSGGLRPAPNGSGIFETIVMTIS